MFEPTVSGVSNMGQEELAFPRTEIPVIRFHIAEYIIMCEEVTKSLLTGIQRFNASKTEVHYYRCSKASSILFITS
jgi:hypothetical protein